MSKSTWNDRDLYETREKFNSPEGFSKETKRTSEFNYNVVLPLKRKRK